MQQMLWHVHAAQAVAAIGVALYTATDRLYYAEPGA
jgi:hypothetical protein